MLLVHYFLPEVGVNMEQVTWQLLRSLSKHRRYVNCGSVSFIDALNYPYWQPMTYCDLSEMICCGYRSLQKQRMRGDSIRETQ